jgi:N12 class adenine-specific DNA methylase
MTIENEDLGFQPETEGEAVSVTTGFSAPAVQQPAKPASAIDALFGPDDQPSPAVARAEQNGTLDAAAEMVKQSAGTPAIDALFGPDDEEADTSHIKDADPSLLPVREQWRCRVADLQRNAADLHKSIPEQDGPERQAALAEYKLNGDELSIAHGMVSRHTAPGGWFGQTGVYQTEEERLSAGQVKLAESQQTIDVTKAAYEKAVADEATVNPRGKTLAVMATAVARRSYDQAQAVVKNAEAMLAGKAPLPTKDWRRAGIDNVVNTFLNTALSDALSGLGSWAAATTGSQSNFLTDAGDALHDKVDQAFVIDQARQDEFGQKIFGGGGSMTAFMATGVVGRGISALAKLKYGGTFASGLSGALSQSAQEFEAARRAMQTAEEVKDKNGNVTLVTPNANQMRIAIAGAIILGATEALPLGKYLGKGAVAVAAKEGRSLAKRTGANVANRIVGGLSQGVEEGVQEFGQGLGGNIVASQTYDPNRDPFEGVSDGAAVGFLLGWGLGGLLHGHSKTTTADSAAAQASITNGQVNVSPDVRRERLKNEAAAKQLIAKGLESGAIDSDGIEAIRELTKSHLSGLKAEVDGIIAAHEQQQAQSLDDDPLAAPSATRLASLRTRGTINDVEPIAAGPEATAPATPDSSAEPLPTDQDVIRWAKGRFGRDAVISKTGDKYAIVGHNEDGNQTQITPAGGADMAALAELGFSPMIGRRGAGGRTRLGRGPQSVNLRNPDQGDLLAPPKAGAAAPAANQAVSGPETKAASSETVSKAGSAQALPLGQGTTTTLDKPANPLAITNPSYKDMEAVLPRDQNGDPDWEQFSDEARARFNVGGWGKLTPVQKLEIYRNFAPKAAPVVDPVDQRVIAKYGEDRAKTYKSVLTPEDYAALAPEGSSEADGAQAAPVEESDEVARARRLANRAAATDSTNIPTGEPTFDRAKAAAKFEAMRNEPAPTTEEESPEIDRARRMANRLAATDSAPQRTGTVKPNWDSTGGSSTDLAYITRFVGYPGIGGAKTSELPKDPSQPFKAGTLDGILTTYKDELSVWLQAKDIRGPKPTADPERPWLNPVSSWEDDATGWYRVAFLKKASDSAGVEHVIVAPALQKQGIGTKLLRIAKVELGVRPSESETVSSAGAALFNSDYRQDRFAANNAQEIVTPDGSMRVMAVPQIVEAATLVKATGARQPRNRNTKESATGSRERAAVLDPQQLRPGRVSDAGAPIAADDSVVISGNGRLESILIAYQTPELKKQADAYRASLGPEAAGMSQPVQIMRLPKMDEAELRRFADLSNRNRIASMSATERAVRDAEAAGADVMALYEGGDFTAPVNARFLQAFINKVVTTNELAEFSKDNQVTKQGEDRMAAAVLAAAYGDPVALQRMLESTDDNIRAITGALRDVAGAFMRLKADIADGQVPAKYDISGQLVEVARLVSELRSNSKSVQEYLDQQDAFNQVPAEIEALLRMLYREDLKKALPRQQITARLMAYAVEASRKREGLFGDDTTLKDVFDYAAEAASQVFADAEGPGSLFEQDRSGRVGDAGNSDNQNVEAQGQSSDDAGDGSDGSGGAIASEPAKPAGPSTLDRFQAIIEGGTLRKDWQKELGLDDIAYASVLGDAERAGIIAPDKRGIPRRTGKTIDPTPDTATAAPEAAPAKPIDPAIAKRIDGTKSEVAADYARKLAESDTDPTAFAGVVADIKADKALKKSQIDQIVNAYTGSKGKAASRGAAFDGLLALNRERAKLRLLTGDTNADPTSLRGQTPALPGDGVSEGGEAAQDRSPVRAPLPGDRAAGNGDVRAPGSADDAAGADRAAERTQRGVSGDTASGGRDRTERAGIAASVKDAENKADEARAKRTAQNYRITEADDVGEGSARAKVRRNLDAIELSKQIENEAREATDYEKRDLVRYVGWGAYAQDVFAEHKPEWAKERQKLKDLLTKDEYEAARASTLNAHYTSPDVIRGMWQALRHLGFDKGRAIEPSAGVGHFIGMQPADMAGKTDWSAVELDKTTGRILAQIYGGAKVHVKGFETVTWPDNFFDLAISNVPFGAYQIRDKAYKNRFSIHDYFFVKSLDKVRPGGVVAFITSSFTLDKQTDTAREEIAKRGEFLGAVRLPGGKKGAFAGNAGTDVTTDIIFLRKRLAGETRDANEAWLTTKEIQTPDGPTNVNAYFAENPQMMLGEMRLTGTQYAAASPVLSGTSENLDARIAEAVIENIAKDVFITREAATQKPNVEPDTDAATNDGIKEGAFYLKGANLFRKVLGVGQPANLSAADVQKVRGFIDVRDTYNALLAKQVKGDREGTAALRKDLNKAYDAFVKKFGPIRKTTVSVTARLNAAGNPVSIRKLPNFNVFRNDPDAYKVAALEIYDEESGKATKAAAFREDIIGAYERPTITGPSDALAVSLNETGGVDMGVIANILGVTPEQAAADLGDAVYLDPNGDTWRTAADYLSGDVLQRLEDARAALANDDKYARNVAALEAVQPAPLTRIDIVTPFGAPWIDPQYYVGFINEVMGARLKTEAVKINPITKKWSVAAKNMLPPSAQTQFGTDRARADEIIEAAMNSEPIRISDPDPTDSKKRILNQEATQAAQAKVQLVKEAWSGNAETGVEGWIWQDNARAEALEAVYNRQFNRLVPTKYDGSHLTLPGLATSIAKADGTVVPFSLRPHQKNAVWRAVQSGNTLFAHVVGAGKTFTMIAAAMEQKRLGLVQRPMFAVPNHMLEQFSGEFLQAYPNAKLLVADKESMSKDKRKEFAARVAAEKWDGIIITHDAFGRIAMSDDFTKDFITKQLAEMEMIKLRVADEEGKNAPTVKDIEKAKKKLEARLDDLVNAEKKDDGITFEELGVDQITIDELHLFKNLGFNSASFSRVRGVSSSAAQRSTDLFMKVQYLDGLHPGRSLNGATGTRVSNSMVELYTMQRYMQLRTMQQYDIADFDAWCRTFGLISSQMELAPDGRSFREVTALAKFVNIPELMSIFGQVADVQTAEMLNLPRPKLKGGKATVVECELGPMESDYVDQLVRRAEKMKTSKVDPAIDNMLKVVSEGRKVATDMRLIDPTAPFNPNGKIAKAVENISRIYKAGKYPALGQIVFLDMGVPQAPAKGKKKQAEISLDDDATRLDRIRSKLAGFDDAGSEASAADARENSELMAGKFDLYNDLRERLVAKGIPKAEIAFIHEAPDDAKKAVLFSKVRSGQVRILIGSTGKMGVGTNVQALMVALHHIDIPWKPSEDEQRNGRVERQGNLNAEIEIIRYLTKGSFDTYSYQTNERKHRFTKQLYLGASGLRVADDIGEGVSEYAELKAAASGDPRIMEHAELSKELSTLEVAKRGHERSILAARQTSAAMASAITLTEKELVNYEADAGNIVETAGDKFVAVLDVGRPGTRYTERKAAGEAIRTYLLDQGRYAYGKDGERKVVGQIGGLRAVFDVRRGSEGVEMRPGIEGAAAYKNRDGWMALTPETDPVGFVKRIENLVAGVPRLAVQTKGDLAVMKGDLPKLEAQAKGAPFAKDARLREVKARVEALTKELSAKPEEAKPETPPDAALGSDYLEADAAEVEKAKAKVAAGGVYDVNTTVVQQQFEAAGPYLSDKPNTYVYAALVRIAPGMKVGNLLATFRRPSGAEFTIEREADVFLGGKRAIMMPNSTRNGGGILALRRVPSSDIGPFANDIVHETGHAVFRDGLLGPLRDDLASLSFGNTASATAKTNVRRKAVIDKVTKLRVVLDGSGVPLSGADRLVAHANLLGILDMPMSDFLAQTGHASAESVGELLSIFELYNMEYAGRADKERAVMIEGFTHMLELIRSGALNDGQIEPIRDLLDKHFPALMANREARKAPASKASDEPKFKLSYTGKGKPPSAKKISTALTPEIQRVIARLPKSIQVAVRERLTTAGLAKLAGVPVSKKAFGGQETTGAYVPFAKLIAVSMADGADVALSTLTHEELHALRDLGLFTKQEWQLLSAAVNERVPRAKALQYIDAVEAHEKAAVGGAIPADVTREIDALRDRAGALSLRDIFQIDAKYAPFLARRLANRAAADSSLHGDDAQLAALDDALTEEAVAFMIGFGQFIEKPSSLTAKVAARIRDILEALGNAYRGLGFNSVSSVERAIDSGKIGARPQKEAGLSGRQIMASIGNRPAARDNPKRPLALASHVTDAIGLPPGTRANMRWDKIVNKHGAKGEVGAELFADVETARTTVEDVLKNWDFVIKHHEGNWNFIKLGEQHDVLVAISSRVDQFGVSEGDTAFAMISSATEAKTDGSLYQYGDVGFKWRPDLEAATRTLALYREARLLRHNPTVRNKILAALTKSQGELAAAAKNKVAPRDVAPTNEQAAEDERRAKLAAAFAKLKNEPKASLRSFFGGEKFSPSVATATPAQQKPGGNATQGAPPGQPNQTSSQTPQGPVRGLSDLIADLNGILGLTQRHGRLDPEMKRIARKMGGELLGQFGHTSGVARIAVPLDLETLAHEGGHKMETDPRFRLQLTQIKADHSAALEQLAGPGADMLSEGFAEFFRLYIVSPGAIRGEAPGLYSDFEDMLDAAAPQVRSMLQQVQEGYTALQASSPKQLVKSRNKSTAKPETVFARNWQEIKDKGFGQYMRDYWYAMQVASMDKATPLRYTIDRLLKIGEANLDLKLAKGQKLAIPALHDAFKRYRLAEHSRVWGTTILQYGVRQRDAQNATGPSMHEILRTAFGGSKKQEWNTDKLDEFGSYLISRRMMAEWDRYNAGVIDFEPDTLIDEATWAASVIEFERDNPTFMEAAEMLYQFNRNHLRYKWQSGFITKEFYKELLDRQDYAPLNRIMDASSKSGGKGAGTNKAAMIREFRGSTRDFINPIESIIQDVYKTQGRVALNDVVGALVTVAEAVGPGGGAIIERIPEKDFKPTVVKVAEVINQAGKQLGIDAGDIQFLMETVDGLFDEDAMATLYHQVDTNENGEPIVYLWAAGKRLAYRLSEDQLGKDIYDLIRAVGQPNASFVTDAFVVGSSMAKKGITLSPPYLVINFIRDQFSTGMSSKNFIPFVTGARGAMAMWRGDDVVRRYGLVAGLMGGVSSASIDSVGQNHNALALRRRGVTASTTTWESVVRMLELGEAASRIGHFQAAERSAIRDGFTPIEAMYEAAFQAHDVMDFSRSGKSMGELNRLAFFFNAGLQGTSAMFRTLSGKRDHGDVVRHVLSPYVDALGGQPLHIEQQKRIPLSARAWIGMVGLFIFTMILAAGNDGDWEMEEDSDYIKAMYWRKKIYGTKVYIPKPYFWNVLGNAGEAAYDGWYKEDPRAAKSFLATVEATIGVPYSNAMNLAMAGWYASQGKPDAANSALDNAMDPNLDVPLIKLFYEHKSNYDTFRDRPIVNEALQGLPPEMRYTASTSTFAKALGKQLHRSPILIDHMITGLGGTLGSDLLKMSNMFDPNRPTPSLEDRFFLSRFMRRTARGALSTEGFWDAMSQSGGEMTMAYKGYHNLITTATPVEAAAFLANLPDDKKAFAIMNQWMPSEDMQLHPLNRAQTIIGILGAVRREMMLGSVLKQDTQIDKRHKDREQEKITISPSDGQTVNEILEDIALREARNALVATGHWGWAQKTIVQTDELYKVLAAVSPDLAAEVSDRLSSKGGRDKIYDFETVRKQWPEVKALLLKDGANADLSDLRGDAKSEESNIRRSLTGE